MYFLQGNVLPEESGPRRLRTGLPLIGIRPANSTELDEGGQHISVSVQATDPGD